jgi:hypothetical protein
MILALASLETGCLLSCAWSYDIGWGYDPVREAYWVLPEMSELSLRCGDPAAWMPDGTPLCLYHAVTMGYWRRGGRTETSQ